MPNLCIKDFAPMEQYTCTRCWKASFPTASFGMRIPQQRYLAWRGDGVCRYCNKCNQHKYPPERQYRRPTGYTLCEHAFGVGATHPASFHDALTEQSARGSLVQAQTRSRLIM